MIEIQNGVHNREIFLFFCLSQNSQHWTRAQLLFNEKLNVEVEKLCPGPIGHARRSLATDGGSTCPD